MSMNVSTTTAAYASYQNNYKTGTANKKKKRKRQIIPRLANNRF